MRLFRAVVPNALVVTVLYLASVGVPTVAAQRAAKKLFTYEQVFQVSGEPSSGQAIANRIFPPLPSIVGWLDDETYLESRRDQDGQPRKVYAIRAADGTARLHVDYGAIQKALPSGVKADDPAASRPGLSSFIYDDGRDLFHFDNVSNRLRRLTATPAPEQNPRFSPDGNWIAYTREHNLYAFDLENQLERQITTDGSDTVYNGWAAWVYYEEILGRSSNYAAFWWSPDSRRLAFMRFDEARVPTFSIFRAAGQHGSMEIQRYPKAGDPNPYVAMGIATVSDGKVIWTDFDGKADHYIAWPVWTPDSRTLMVQWMNRGQDTIRFYHCDIDTGKIRQVFEERQPSWVEFFEDVHYFRDGRRFLLRSNVDGWDHLYLYNVDGALEKRLTAGQWRVTSIVRVDEDRGQVFFMARQEPTWDTRLMRVQLDAAAVEPVSAEPGVHGVNLSPRASYFIDTVSTLTTPSRMTLRRRDGSPVRLLADQRTETFDEYAWGKAELFTIPSGDGYALPAWWVLPTDFNPARAYPVMISVYGGPDAGTVRNAWLGLKPHYWAQHGVISMSVDHRGSGHFGKAGVALMHRQLGKWELHDLTAATKWLRARPFVSKDHIGIDGASYGGYVTLMALTQGAKDFNAGIAGSPVTDWQLYDTVYTERYMDTPAENADGYKQGAVLTWIDSYRGGLYLTHGTIDDNVHVQNSLQVIDWLTVHNRPFELMLYPDSRHALRPAQRAHADRESHKFWFRTLLGRDVSLQ